QRPGGPAPAASELSCTGIPRTPPAPSRRAALQHEQAPQQLPAPAPPTPSQAAGPAGHLGPLPRGLSRRARSVDSGGREPSWDEVSQTSSTSGYRESYTMLATTLESPPTPGAAVVAVSGGLVHGRSFPPPLASPDAHDLPSSSSAATNCPLAEGSSPDSSTRSPGGEEVALLGRRDHSASQHSLLMMFDTQDEDTLI
ncbi:Uncharacterized protein GBIM_04079, partial [Gryllus bimaculatus]